MRHLQLRRFFVGLASIATPISLGIVGCGGTVITDHDGDQGGSAGADHQAPGAGTGGSRNTGGFPGYAGGGGPGSTGGFPGFVGTTPGGYPNYTGMGGAVATGGVPIYVGTGGSPIYTGMGGSTNGYPPLDAGSVVDPPDANVVDDAGCELPDGALGPSGCGRKPPGLATSPRSAGSAVCRYFEAMAQLEAASVPAFRILGHELRAHGAPRSLVLATRRAAREEIRHTRAARILAERVGGRYIPPHIERRPPRSLEDLALDNMAEGCVRETFGAMIATWQSRASGDAVVRAIMRRIAVEETSHAALAIRVAEWTNRRLSENAVLRVRDVRRATSEAVRRELEASHTSPDLAAIAGVPSREDALGLARAMHDQLWA